MCSTNTLIHLCIVIGSLFSVASVVGICMSLYLVFGDPIRNFARDTYTPSWEDIGPAMACSVISLVANVVLIGGARQQMRHFMLTWILWKIALVLIFWAWFGYNHLKHQGYISGLRGCYFCGLNPEEMSVTFGGILCCVIIIFTLLPVTILKGRFNKAHRLAHGAGPAAHFSDSRQYLAESPPHHYQELTPFQQSQPNDQQFLQVQSLQEQQFKQMGFQQLLNMSQDHQIGFQQQLNMSQDHQIGFQLQNLGQDQFSQHNMSQSYGHLTPEQFQQLQQQQIYQLQHQQQQQLLQQQLQQSQQFAPSQQQFSPSQQQFAPSQQQFAPSQQQFAPSQQQLQQSQQFAPSQQQLQQSQQFAHPLQLTQEQLQQVQQMPQNQQQYYLQNGQNVTHFQYH